MGDLGTHAKPGDVLVGRLSDPIGMYRDEVYLRDLSPELRALLHAAQEYADHFDEQAMHTGCSFYQDDATYACQPKDRLADASLAFTRSVRP